MQTARHTSRAPRHTVRMQLVLVDASSAKGVTAKEQHARGKAQVHSNNYSVSPVHVSSRREGSPPTQQHLWAHVRDGAAATTGSQEQKHSQRTAWQIHHPAHTNCHHVYANCHNHSVHIHNAFKGTHTGRACVVCQHIQAPPIPHPDSSHTP
jgi:hypothetical protein